MKQLLRGWIFELAIGLPIFYAAYVLGLWDALPLWGFAIFAIGVWTIAERVTNLLGLEVEP